MKSEAIQRHRPSMIAASSIEWPTVVLIAIHWFAFFALTMLYHALPWWIVLPLGGYLIALFGSLQHEVLHGHPTPNPWINEAIIFPNIALWMPYSLYKTTHLTHHINHQLTNPTLDPESYYIDAEKWQRYPKYLQAYYRFYNTFIGRFFWGPIHIILILWMTEARALLSGNTQTISIWIVHVIACLPVLYWVIVICQIPLVEYLLLFVYPGLALTLLRSFIEHQAVENFHKRSIIIETNPIVSLMYLNNNLHAVHHVHPHLAWFHLPSVWKNDRKEILAENGNYYFNGYFRIIYRFWKTPKEQPEFPL